MKLSRLGALFDSFELHLAKPVRPKYYIDVVKLLFNMMFFILLLLLLYYFGEKKNEGQLCFLAPASSCRLRCLRLRQRIFCSSCNKDLNEETRFVFSLHFNIAYK